MVQSQEIPEAFQTLAAPAYVTDLYRSVTGMAPAPAVLPAWRATIAEVAKQAGDPAEVRDAMEWYRTAQKRPNWPEPRFMRADWLAKILSQYRANKPKIPDASWYQVAEEDKL